MTIPVCLVRSFERLRKTSFHRRESLGDVSMGGFVLYKGWVAVGSSESAVPVPSPGAGWQLLFCSMSSLRGGVPAVICFAVSIVSKRQNLKENLILLLKRNKKKKRKSS